MRKVGPVEGRNTASCASASTGDQYALAVIGANPDDLGEGERLMQALGEEARHTPLPNATELSAKMAGLMNRATNTEGMFMLSPDGDAGREGPLRTPEELAAAQNYNFRDEQEKVMWTFLAGQPVRTTDIDQYIQNVIPGPIAIGERPHAIRQEDRRPELRQRSDAFPVGALRAREGDAHIRG
jgi:hypothetical protein